MAFTGAISAEMSWRDNTINTEANKKVEIYTNGVRPAIEELFSDHLTKLNKATSDNNEKTDALLLKVIGDINKAHSENDEKKKADYQNNIQGMKKKIEEMETAS